MGLKLPTLAGQEPKQLSDDTSHLERLGKQIAELASKIDAGYQSLIQFQKHNIPRYLRNMQNFNANGTSLELQYQSQNLHRITCFLIVVTSAGTLQIGQKWSLPVAPGMLPLDLGLEGMVLDPGQQITLTQNVQGAMGIWAFGQELPDRGNRW